MTCVVKKAKKPFVPKRKVWKVNEDKTRVEFENVSQRLSQGSGQKTGAEDIYELINQLLIPTTKKYLPVEFPPTKFLFPPLKVNSPH